MQGRDLEEKAVGLRVLVGSGLSLSLTQGQKAGVGTLPQAVSTGRVFKSWMLSPCTSKSTMKSGVRMAFTANTSVGSATATLDTFKNISRLTEPAAMLCPE